MSDFKASIKIEFEFMDVRDSVDMFINYCPADCCNMDKRVIAFFDRIYGEGMAAYNKMIREQYNEEHKEDIIQQKRLLLKRLQDELKED